MTQMDGGFAAQDADDVRAGLDRVEASAQRMSRTLTRAFASAVVSGKSFEDTLKGVALALSKMALNSAMKPLQQGVSSSLNALMSAFSSSGGSPAITPFADGGVVARPTFFGAQGGLGLMGERGAEAIMPLARGADGRLGVAMTGGGARAPIVNVTINTPDVESFRRSQVEVSAALARAVGRGRRGL
jgi:phage-related minor tail protein